MNKTSEAIEVVVPLNYKTSGDEDLQCMTYNQNSSSWTSDQIETTLITDSYVVCKTNQLNAITVVDNKHKTILFKKNYGIYCVIFQIIFFAAVLFLLSFFIKLDNYNKLYFSTSPLLCLLTCSNNIHRVAKLLLFLAQISAIEMVIALLYKKNEDLSEGGSRNIVLTIFFALLAGYFIKYLFGSILSKIYQKELQQIVISYLLNQSCAAFIGFMSAIYIAFSFIICYSISNPNYDDAVKLGVKTTFLALLFDFIIFDVLIILGLKFANLESKNMKILQAGGYLTIDQQKQFLKIQSSASLTKDLSPQDQTVQGYEKNVTNIQLFDANEEENKKAAEVAEEENKILDSENN